MLSNLRAAQALSSEHVATALRRHPPLRYGDLVPDWVTSPVVRLSTRRTSVGTHKRHRTRRAA